MSSVTFTTTNVGGFLPTNISGCSLWLDGADPNATGTLPANGASVSTWTDKSGNARNATQGTGGNQPTYNASTRGITFNGSSSFLNMSNAFTMLGSGALMTAFVVEKRGAASVNQMFWFSGNTLGSGVYFGYNNATTVRYTFTIAVDLDTSVAAFTTPEPTRIWGCGYNTAATAFRDIYLNGTLSIQTNYASGGPASWPGAVIGRLNLPSIPLDFFYNGEIYEMIFYNSYLSTSQRQQVEGYLAWKWGLLRELPQLHPYKNLPIFTLTTSNQFEPTAIPGSLLWLDAADSTTVTVSGTNVTNVRDKSSRNVTLSNATGFTYPNNTFNGTLPSFFSAAVGFPTATSANQLGRNASQAWVAPFTVFFVAHQTVTSNLYGYLLDSVGGVSRPYTYTPQVQTPFAVYPSPFTINPSIVTLGFVPGTATSYLIANGSNAAQVTGNLGALTTDGIIVGNRFSLTEAWPGHICEVIAYDTNLSLANRQVIEGYLAWKWRLQASLPAAHPYKNEPVYFYSPTISQLTLPRSIRPAFFTNPGSLATLEYWFDASDLSTISGSGTTLALANKGTAGSAGNLSRNAGTPTSGVVSQNGLNCIGMGNTVRMIFTAHFTGPLGRQQPRTRFFATRPTVNTTNTNVVFLHQELNAINGNDYCALEGTSGALEVAQGQIVNMQTAAMPNHQNQFFIYTFRNAATAANNRIAFTGTNINLTTSVFANQYRDAAVTTHINSTTGNVSAQDLGEWLSYSSELSQAQTETIEGYLAWKWGVQGSLPANHPFRFFPPPP